MRTEGTPAASRRTPPSRSSTTPRAPLRPVQSRRRWSGARRGSASTCHRPAASAANSGWARWSARARCRSRDTPRTGCGWRCRVRAPARTGTRTGL